MNTDMQTETKNSLAVALLVAALNALAVGFTATVRTVSAAVRWAIPALCRDCDADDDTEAKSTCGRCVDCALTDRAAPQWLKRALSAARIVGRLGTLAVLALAFAAVCYATADGGLEVGLGTAPLLPILRTRRPIPDDVKAAAANLGGSARRESTGRSFTCRKCGGDFEAGAVKVLGFEITKRFSGPICGDCAVKAGFRPKEAEPTPEPKPEPTPAPKADPEPRKIVVPNPDAPRGVTVPTDTVSDAAAALAAALAAQTAPVDEAQVRAIAAEAAAEAVKGLTRRLVIQTPEEAEDVPDGRGSAPVHGKVPQVLWSIIKAGLRNLNLIGPAGTGKTHMAQQIHGLLIKAGLLPENAPFVCISANGEMLPSDLLGRMSPAFFGGDGDDAPAPGDWVFSPGGMLRKDGQDVLQAPSVILIDEMDRFNAGTSVGLNALLANGFITDPNGKVWTRHEDCIIIATGNTRGMGADGDYAAAQKQDSATLDRFAGAFFDIDFCPGIEAFLGPDVADGIRALRDFAATIRANGVMFSYRAITAAQGLVDAGMSTGQALRQICAPFGPDFTADAAAANLCANAAGEPDFAAMLGWDNPAGAA